MHNAVCRRTTWQTKTTPDVDDANPRQSQRQWQVRVYVVRNGRKAACTYGASDDSGYALGSRRTLPRGRNQTRRGPSTGFYSEGHDFPLDVDLFIKALQQFRYTVVIEPASPQQIGQHRGGRGHPPSHKPAHQLQ